MTTWDVGRVWFGDSRSTRCPAGVLMVEETQTPPSKRNPESRLEFKMLKGLTRTSRDQWVSERSLLDEERDAEAVGM